MADLGIKIVKIGENAKADPYLLPERGIFWPSVSGGCAPTARSVGRLKRQLPFLLLAGHSLQAASAPAASVASQAEPRNYPVIPNVCEESSYYYNYNYSIVASAPGRFRHGRPTFWHRPRHRPKSRQKGYGHKKSAEGHSKRAKISNYPKFLYALFDHPSETRIF